MSVRYDPARSCNGKEQVGLQLMRSWALGRWGGIDAGLYNCRNVRGGSTLSLHAEGRAWDWRPPSRAILLDAIGIVLAHADALNVQYLVDYVGRRAWRTGRGWAPFTGFGAGSLPNWHLERNWTGALDVRPIATIIASPTRPPDVGSTPEPESEMRLTGQKATITGRLACASTQDRAVLLWNGATVEGDAKFGTGLRVWTPPQPHPLVGVDIDRERHLVVALATDGGTFAAKMRAGTY